ncbi:MAG: sensor histidine kinase [Nitriliruptorales bacterium]
MRRLKDAVHVPDTGGEDLPRWTWVLSAAVVVVFAVVSVFDPVSVFDHGHSQPSHPAAIALVAVSTLPWLLGAVGVRMHPLPKWLLAMLPLAVLNLGGEALGIAGLGSEEQNQFSLMIALFAVGEVVSHAPVGVASLVTVLGLGTVVGRGVVEPAFTVWPFWFVGGGSMALLVGVFLRRQQTMLGELRAAQSALSREAAQRERERIAREVHDVVAHTLTVTMMHLTAARMAIGRDDTEAREALADAERLGRQSLADLRRTMGFLRTDPELPTDPPLPGAADVGELVGSYRGAGVDVDLTVEDGLDALGPSEQLAVYRVLQEAIANAAKHAPGAPVSARIGCDAGDVLVEVANGRGRRGTAVIDAGAGVGVVGMRERIALLGGELSVGPEGDGWRVTARVPRGRRAPSPRGIIERSAWSDEEGGWSCGPRSRR